MINGWNIKETTILKTLVSLRRTNTPGKAYKAIPRWEEQQKVTDILVNLGFATKKVSITLTAKGASVADSLAPLFPESYGGVA